MTYCVGAIQSPWKCPTFTAVLTAVRPPDQSKQYARLMRRTSRPDNLVATRSSEQRQRGRERDQVMLQRILTRLAWVLVAGTVLSGLGLAALWAVKLFSDSWSLVLSPVWIPLAIAGVLLALGLAWTGCRAMMAAAIREPSDEGGGTSRARRSALGAVPDARRGSASLPIDLIQPGDGRAAPARDPASSRTQ